jgi:hypothetical protein
MRKQQIAIIALTVWLPLITVFMLISQGFDLDVFFALSFIGFLIIVELITPKYIQPDYMRFIKYIRAAAIVIIGLIILQKVMEIL